MKCKEESPYALTINEHASLFSKVNAFPYFVIFRALSFAAESRTRALTCSATSSNWRLQPNWKWRPGYVNYWPPAGGTKKGATRCREADRCANLMWTSDWLDDLIPLIKFLRWSSKNNRSETEKWLPIRIIKNFGQRNKSLEITSTFTPRRKHESVGSGGFLIVAINEQTTWYLI